MKKNLLIVLALFISSFSFAQLGTAEDFTITDINGNEHNLYSILDQGKVVVLDVSATWCGPCWTLHQNHYLEDLNETYGPNGTDQIRVIFYEGDAATDNDALNGISGNTLGDWVTGVSYPIINESPITLSLSLYAPEGFPTVNIIRPTDKEIIADAWNYDLQGMIDAITPILQPVVTVGTNDLEENANVEVYPNPAADFLWVDLEEVNTEIDQIEIHNALGQRVHTIAITTDTKISIALNDYAAGLYVVNLQSKNQTVAVKKFVKD